EPRRAVRRRRRLDVARQHCDHRSAWRDRRGSDQRNNGHPLRRCRYRQSAEGAPAFRRRRSLLAAGCVLVLGEARNVNVPEHIAALRGRGELLASAADGGDPDAPLPYCPDWKLRDVVQHTGEVHRWATDVVANGRTEPTDSDPTYPNDGELVGWFREGHVALVDALTNAPDDLDCFAFLPAPTPLAFWARRQAHETAIHRVDAESATRTRTPFVSDFATDG